MLFQDNELFTSGARARLEYNLPDADIVLIDAFFNKEESDYYYNTFLNSTNWSEYEMKMYDKQVKAPRLISWHEDLDIATDNLTQAFTKDLNDIRLKVQKETNLDFNAVLLNLYRNGNDSVAWHSDKTHRTTHNPTIASVSFGETRIFKLRHKTRKDIPVIEIPLYHGTFLLMAGTTNSFWEHQVPRTSREILPRINLTFRQLIKK